MKYFLFVSFFLITLVSHTARADSAIQIPLNESYKEFCSKCDVIALPSTRLLIQKMTSNTVEKEIIIDIPVAFTVFEMAACLKSGLDENDLAAAEKRCALLELKNRLRFQYPDNEQGKKLLADIEWLKKTATEEKQDVTFEMQGWNDVSTSGCEDNTVSDLILIRPDCGSQTVHKPELYLVRNK